MSGENPGVKISQAPSPALAPELGVRQATELARSPQEEMHWARRLQALASSLSHRAETTINKIDQTLQSNKTATASRSENSVGSFTQNKIVSSQLADDARVEAQHYWSVIEIAKNVAKTVLPYISPARLVQYVWEHPKMILDFAGTLLRGTLDGLGLVDLYHGIKNGELSRIGIGILKFTGIQDIIDGCASFREGHPIWGSAQIGIGLLSLCTLGAMGLATKPVKVALFNSVRENFVQLSKVTAKAVTSKLPRELLENAAERAAHNSVKALKELLATMDEAAKAMLRSDPARQIEIMRQIVKSQVADVVRELVKHPVAEVSERMFRSLAGASRKELREIAQSTGLEFRTLRRMQRQIGDRSLQNSMIEALEEGMIPTITRHVEDGMRDSFKRVFSREIDDVARRSRLSREALEEGAERGFKEGVEVGVKRGVREGLEEGFRRFRRKFDHSGSNKDNEHKLGRFKSDRSDDKWSDERRIWKWQRREEYDGPDLYKKRDEFVDDHYAKAMEELGKELIAKAERDRAVAMNRLHLK